MREVTVRALSSPVRTVRDQTADAAAPTGGVPAGHAGVHRRAASHL